MSKVWPCARPIRMRSSPSLRSGSEAARSVCPAPRGARGGDHHGAFAHGQFPALAVYDVDIRGQAGVERVGRVVGRVRRQRVVIARQQDHGPGPVAAHELAQYAAPPRLVRRRVVEEIARAEHRVDVALSARSRIRPTASSRARVSCCSWSRSKAGKRRPRCQSAVCSSVNATSCSCAGARSVTRSRTRQRAGVRPWVRHTAGGAPVGGHVRR